MSESKLTNFSNHFIEHHHELADENPDVTAKISIDGFPDDNQASGRVVCEIFITKHGDIVTAWRERAYQPDVRELVKESIKTLKERSPAHAQL